MSTISPQRARALVQEIAHEHGHLGEDVYERMEPGVRRAVEQAMLKKDALIGSAVSTLAKNLYTADVRFIFELLQNADDNKFSIAAGLGSSPLVSFSLYENRIVVDCNEDGFSGANLRAICAVGQSSKTAAQGYIGEKGIGFKSVFKVAWKVHIQSGNFSFAFKHRPGGSGMGMISPEWEEPVYELQGPLTRMTFSLHDDGDADEGRIEQRRNIIDQLHDLQPAMLLFLKNLKRIEIRFFDIKDNETSSSILLRDQGCTPHLTLLKNSRTQGNGSDPQCTLQTYWVTKRLATGLPRNENRAYSTEEESLKDSESVVVLAFPLSDTLKPVIEPQQLFAFLPIRRAGFNFLIHSDFVTLANREDISTNSRRNLALLDAVAKTFVHAVDEMCDHPQLRYRWMEYLPDPSGHPWDNFWKKLVDQLKKQVTQAPVLVTHSSLSHRLMKSVRTQYAEMIDSQGSPLFRDLEGNDAIYISPQYSQKAISILRGYGLQYIDMLQFLDRVSMDLTIPGSTMKSKTTDDDWHARAAKLLTSKLTVSKTRIKALSLVPLSNGRWIASTDGPVYLPTTTAGVTIPAVLGLQIIHPAAAAHEQRKDLFDALGAITAPDNYIRGLVFDKYDKLRKTGSIDLDTSVELLKFLYITSSEGSLADERMISVGLYDSESKWRFPCTEKVYILSNSPYGPYKLGLPVPFAHPRYFKDVPQPGKGYMQRDWTFWLEAHLRLHQDLTLTETIFSDSISKECRYVAEHLPKSFLSLIKVLVNSAKLRIIWKADLAEELMSIEVLCQGGKKYPMRDTVLPLPRLRQIVSQFLVGRESFPFLELETPLVDQSARDWDFLDNLRVTKNDDLPFYLAILKAIVDGNKYPEHLRQIKRVWDLYVRIHSKCVDDAEQDVARSFFKETRAILIPGVIDEHEPAWCTTEDCLLGAPLDLHTKLSVSLTDIDWPGVKKTNINRIVDFFQVTLGVRECSWGDLVEDLRYMKETDGSDLDIAQNRYKTIHTKYSASCEELREVFEKDALILYCRFDCGIKDFTWHKPSDCVWSTGTDIRGKPNLAMKYDHSLEDFFLKALHIQTLSIEMVFHELMSLDPGHVTVDQAKTLLWSLNSLLETDTLPEDSLPADLLERPILPIEHPGGQVILNSAKTAFAIVDRKQLGDAFQGQVNTLDFTMTEVNKLQPFVEWAGLGNRYMSRMVSETSALSSGEKWPASENRFDIKRKAHGLLRIATHFKSPRVLQDQKGFYELLQAAETWETHGISSILKLSMGNAEFTAEVGQSEVHIDYDDYATQLKVYIPHNEELQDLCIQHTLPEKLVEWMVRDTCTESTRRVDYPAVGVVKGLLNAKIASVARLLEKEGIINVDIPNTDPEIPGRAEVQIEVHVAESESQALVHATGRSPASLFHTHSSPVSAVPNNTPAEYVRLLRHMITAARKIRFPSRRGFDMHPLSVALVQNSNEVFRPFDDRSLFPPNTPRYQRDPKIGAAGELFVFELLCALTPNLPVFFLDNWTSNLRHYARGVSEYQSIPD